MSMITALYTGEFHLESRDMREVPGWQEAASSLCARYDGLHAMLDAGQKERLDALMAAKADIFAIEQQDAFREGFCLGARLMLEIRAEKG